MFGGLLTACPQELGQKVNYKFEQKRKERKEKKKKNQPKGQLTGGVSSELLRSCFPSQESVSMLSVLRPCATWVNAVWIRKTDLYS